MESPAEKGFLPGRRDSNLFTAVWDKDPLRSDLDFSYQPIKNVFSPRF